MTPFDTNKVALVTGASSGIGEAIALRLAAMGVTTYAAARRLDRMKHLEEKGIRVLGLDLTDEVSIEACNRTITIETDGIDILVNNAGYGSYGSFEEIPLGEARRQFEVNLFGLARLAQLAIPRMRTNRSGWIVNVSSIGGVGASPYGSWYHATKFALEGLTSALRQELNPFGVNVVILRPGAIDTEWRGIAGASLLERSGRPLRQSDAGDVRKVHGARLRQDGRKSEGHRGRRRGDPAVAEAEVCLHRTPHGADHDLGDIAARK
jgi:short-subunit dehydrogenase